MLAYLFSGPLHIQGIRQAVEDYNAIATRISAAQDQANSTHATAEELQSRAEDLNAKANQVSLQDLKGTLQQEKIQLLSDLNLSFPLCINQTFSIDTTMKLLW